MVDVGTAIADMWSKIGVKVTTKHYEWGAFPPLVRAKDQDALTGWASMYRTVGRPDSPWRYNAAFSSQIETGERLFGDNTNCDAVCKRYDELDRAVVNERDPKKRTEINDQLIEHVANAWMSIPVIEGMGYYAVNRTKAGEFKPIPGRHELGDVFERIPRSDQKPWPKK
jgi:peptide/nickel transport system substrate-binding protein